MQPLASDGRKVYLKNKLAVVLERKFAMKAVCRFLVPVLIAGLVHAACQGQEPSIQEPELREELLRRVKVDQEAREKISGWMNQEGDDDKGDSVPETERQAEFARIAEELSRIDTENTEWLRKVVDTHGWPGASMVGKDGANAAWLLVQHADLSPDFQRRCLDLMVAMPAEEVSRGNIAYLTDRVLLAEGKNQVHGTQFTEKDGEWVPRPLDDPENVDKRRAEAGLPPLAEYVEQLKAAYGGGGTGK
jgi:hypothetical protein